nr:GTPase HflX [Bacilli bacterium]
MLEKVVIMMVHHHDRPQQKREHDRDEMIGLIEASDGQVVAICEQAIEHVNPKTMIGMGKVDELKGTIEQHEADLVVFSVDLTGSQLRNIEESCGCRVIDRTQLILAIFASRAQSHEGIAQVKLAQLSYLLPRLTGRGIAMSRLGAGIGTRGPGETKLETDRRKIREEIHQLKRVLQKQKARRQELRKRRASQGVYSIGIVGYTNAGKTTLLSKLAKRYGERMMATGQDRLFDTLDLLSRRLNYEGRTFVVTDTVGFLRDLPHHLVDAFRATMEEAVDADVLLHVVDATSSFMDDEIATVHQVITKELASVAPVVTLFNVKSKDLSAMSIVYRDPLAEQTVVGSIFEDKVLQEIMEAIDHIVAKRLHLELLIPHDRSDIVALAYQIANVVSVTGQEAGMLLTMTIDARYARQFLPFTMLT